MVSDGKKNRCGACGQELLGRNEVERIVRGVDYVWKMREFMRWETYMNNGTYIYAKVCGVTGSRGETKNIVCGCNYKQVCSPSMMMIREQYRHAVKAVFGDVLSAPFLFSIPPAMVAWENSAMVHVQRSEEGMVLSDEGVALIEFVADMSRQRLFDGSMVKYSVEDVLGKFSYLHMILPRYRSFVASDFGEAASMKSLLASVPVDWIDWDNMLALRCVEENGQLLLSRAVGMPLVSAFAKVVSKKKPNPVFVRPVADGAAVTINNTCVQILQTGGVDGNVPNIEPSVVVLATGKAFIPAGELLLSGDHLAVTFEPGVVLETQKGTLVTAPSGAVTLFLNGQVRVKLTQRDNHMHGFCPGHPSEMEELAYMYQVPVVCDSYEEGTPLFRWYNKRFTVSSSKAFFHSDTAELVLLSHFQDSDVDGEQVTFDEHNALVDEDGIGTFHWESGEIRMDKIYRGFGGVCTLVKPRTYDINAVLVVAGCLEMSGESTVGLIGDATLSFAESRDCAASRWEDYTTAVFTATLERKFVGDDTSFVEGGSYDRACDDIDTYVSSKALDVLVCVKNGRELPSFSKLAKHPLTLLHFLGVRPSVNELLWSDENYFDRDKVLNCAMKNVNGEWLFGDFSQYDVSMLDLARIGRSWRPWYAGGMCRTLFDLITDNYPDVDGVEFTMFDRCL